MNRNEVIKRLNNLGDRAAKSLKLNSVGAEYFRAAMMLAYEYGRHVEIERQKNEVDRTVADAPPQAAPDA